MHVPKYPSNVAQTIAKEVKFHVEGIAGESILIDNEEWVDSDKEFGIFHRDELQLGELLGSGGFSEVYEVLNFNFSECGNRILSNSQVAARKQYQSAPLGTTGKSKYVIKHLKADLMDEFSLFCIAACDLVLEAQYLSRLNHENVLKIYGWSYGGAESFSNGKHDDYFLVLERLNETLDNRIKSWKTRKSNPPIAENDGNTMRERTNVACGIAAALEYLHRKNIVFRDLKPDNVGFDDRGTVKIFDFGMARELPRKIVNVNEVYEMSGKIGTIRYMAPEVLLGQRYNQKVDSYSWSMLFWTCLALELPYGNMTRSDYAVLVCQQGQRPSVSDYRWSDNICDLLENAWAQSVRYRYGMSKVCDCLRNIQKEMESS